MRLWSRRQVLSILKEARKDMPQEPWWCNHPLASGLLSLWVRLAFSAMPESRGQCSSLTSTWAPTSCIRLLPPLGLGHRQLHM